MDKVKKYKQIAQKVLDDVLEMMKNIDNTEVFEVNEVEKGHFLLMTDGWDGIERSYGPLIHIEVKSTGKVWLRQDGTDLEIGQILLDKGVATDDIVLAFYSPNMRKYTDYAVA